jgi:hypothetical protein
MNTVIVEIITGAKQRPKAIVEEWFALEGFSGLF